jgi:hypothetical protein
MTDTARRDLIRPDGPCVRDFAKERIEYLERALKDEQDRYDDLRKRDIKENEVNKGFQCIKCGQIYRKPMAEDTCFRCWPDESEQDAQSGVRATAYWFIGAAVIVLVLLVASLYSTTAHGAEVYLQGGLAYQFRHPACDINGHVAEYCRFDRTEYSPMLGHVELGVAQSMGRWQGTVYARHESLPCTGKDYGVDQVGVSLRVRLWGRP